MDRVLRKEGYSMIEDTQFLDEFGIYELEQYVTAKEALSQKELDYEEAIQDLYDDCSPTMTYLDEEVGLWYSRSYRVENMAILIVETREIYENEIKHLKQKIQLFDKALSSLEPLEQSVFKTYYHGSPDDLDLSESVFYEVFLKAQKKLCAFLEKARTERQELLKEKRHQELLKKAGKLRNHLKTNDDFEMPRTRVKVF
jgi:hypothetical protein